jgi:hypothetical protein
MQTTPSPTSVMTLTIDNPSATPEVASTSMSLGRTETASIVPDNPNATPTKSNIYNNPNQVTDGKLKLSIKEVNNTCYKPGTRIRIILTYENLTNKNMEIVDYNAISTRPMDSNAQLYPVLTTLLNVRLFSLEDFIEAEVYNPDSPLLQELPANDELEVTVEYYFPPDFMIDRMRFNETQPPPPGQYFLKLVYVAYHYEHAWEGKISSNQIKLCIR